MAMRLQVINPREVGENIIIDFSGFSDETGHLPPTWIYTAITRAKTKLYIVNYPEELNV